MVILLSMLILSQCRQYSVDQPNTRILGHGEYEASLRFGPSGGVLGYFGVGLVDRFSFGMSLGGANLLGSDDPEFYSPGVQVKIQVLPGGLTAPEWALGFDNQGFGAHSDGRYAVKSKGLYTSAGKGFAFGGGEIYLFGGANYTLEDKDESALDIFFGQELNMLDQFSVLIDYDPAFNDAGTEDRGYLNAALRLNLAESVVFEFALRDILGNGAEHQNRLIKLAYQGSF